MNLSLSTSPLALNFHAICVSSAALARTSRENNYVGVPKPSGEASRVMHEMKGKVNNIWNKCKKEGSQSQVPSERLDPRLQEELRAEAT